MSVKLKIGAVILRLMLLPMTEKKAHKFLDGVAAKTSQKGKAIVEQERKRVISVFRQAA